jgi:hypothetical protein
MIQTKQQGLGKADHIAGSQQIQHLVDMRILAVVDFHPTKSGTFLFVPHIAKCAYIATRCNCSG